MSDTKKTIKAKATDVAAKVDAVETKAAEKTETVVSKVSATVADAKEKVSATATDIKETAVTTTSAVREAATAYVTGVSDLTKTAFGISKEVVSETVEHGKTSLKANSVRSLAEMQAGYVQHRIEAAPVHVKAVADVAKKTVANVYSPLINLLKDRKAA